MEKTGCSRPVQTSCQKTECPLTKHRLLAEYRPPLRIWTRSWSTNHWQSRDFPYRAWAPSNRVQTYLQCHTELAEYHKSISRHCTESVSLLSPQPPIRQRAALTCSRRPARGRDSWCRRGHGRRAWRFRGNQRGTSRSGPPRCCAGSPVGRTASVSAVRQAAAAGAGSSGVSITSPQSGARNLHRHPCQHQVPATT